MRARSNLFAILATLAMGLLVVLSGCSRESEKLHAFAPDKNDQELGINQHQPGFFVLRYTAYRGEHRLGGTLNEVSIRNLSDEPMHVETLTLSQIFRGREVTLDQTPVPYSGMNGGILAGSQPGKRSDIAPGEWMSFDFPTKEITEFKVGDQMHLTFAVVLRAGAKRYENKVEFTKTLIESELSPL